MENKNTENITKRLKESRKEVAELQGELQRLISQGLNIHSPPKNQQEQLSNIKKSHKTQADEELIKIRDKVFNLRKDEEEKKFNFDEIVVGKQERKNEERNRRQELREYTRQQKEKRRQAAKVCDQQKINKELVQKNLDELNKKAKTLLAVNLQKRDRSRSKSPSKLNANTNVPDLIIPHFTQRSSACSTTRRSQTSRSQDRNLTTKDKEQFAQQEKTDIKNVKKPLSTINKNITVRQADVEDKDDTIAAVDKLIQASIDKEKEKAEKYKIQNQKSIDKETVEKIIQKSLNKDKDKVEKIIQTSLSLKEQKEKAEKIIQTTLLNELEDKKREEKIVQTSLCSNNERITKINNKSSNLNLNLNLNTMMPSDSYNIVNSVKRKLYSAINQYNMNQNDENFKSKLKASCVDVGTQKDTPKNSQELKELIKRKEVPLNTNYSQKSHSHSHLSEEGKIKRDLKIIASSFQLERSGSNNNKPSSRRTLEDEEKCNGDCSDTSKDALTEELLSTDLDSLKSSIKPSQNINFERDGLQVPSNEGLKLNLNLNLKAAMPEYVYGVYDKIVSSSGPLKKQLSDNEKEKKSSNHSSVKSIVKSNSNSNSNINTERRDSRNFDDNSNNKELTLTSKQARKGEESSQSQSQTQKSFKTLNTATEEISDNIAAIPHSTSLSLATMSSHSTNTNNNDGKRKISESFKSLNTATKTQSEYESEQKSQTVSISERQQQQQEIDSSKAYSSNFISSATSSANVPSLKHPSVSLRSVRTSECVNVKETRIQEGNVHRLSLKAGEKTTLETKTNSNQIYLKFETELHLLNDFNESLRQFMEVEKSLLELHSKKLTAEEPAITQTIIPQQQNRQEQENEQQQELMILQKQNAQQQQNRILVKDAQTSMGSFKSASEPIITASKEEKLINKRKERQSHTRSMHPSINYSREEENSLIIDDLGSTSAFDTTNIEINSINFIEDCEKTIEATSNNSNISNTLESVVDLSSCKENILENNIQAGLSLKMFDYLIKEEDAKIENLKTILRIREKALLDRYKGELAWLNIQMRHYKETEQLQEMSVIKKRQRGLIIKLQHETQEMQRLKQVQKKASNERKTYLKQQQRMIKEHLSTNNSIPGNNVISKFKSKSSSLNSLKERPSIGPLKVYNVHHTTTTTTTAESSIKSETSIPNSKQQNSNSNSNSIIQEEIQVVNVNVTSVVQHTSSDGQNSDSVENEILTKSQRNLLVNTNTNSNATNSINSERNKLEVAKRTLLMHESVLQKRRQAAEELLIWHQRLLEEEKKVSELEMAASSIINQVHSPNVETLEKGKVHNFKGDQLNILWQNMTGRDEKKFKDNETYLFDQNALKKFCLDAKNCMNQEQTTTNQQQQSQIQQKTNQRPENVLITLTSNTNNNSAIQIPQLLPQQQQNQATNNKKEDLLTINSIKETIRYDMAINNLLNSSSSIKSTTTQDSSSIHHHSSISSKLTKSKSTPEIKEKERDLTSKSTSEIKEKEQDSKSKKSTSSEIKEEDLKSKKSTSEIKEEDSKSKKSTSEIKEEDSKSKKSTSSEIKEEDLKSSTKSIQTEKESKKSSDKSLTKENSSSIKLMNDEETLINEEEFKSSELSKDLSVRKSSSLSINDDLMNEDKNNKEFGSSSKLSEEKQKSIKLQSKSSLSDSLQINEEVPSSSSLPKLNEELTINEVLSVKSQAKSSLSDSLQINEEVPSFSSTKLNEELSINEVLSVKSQSSLSCSLSQVNDNEGEEEVPSSVSEELSSVIKSSNSNSSQELIKSKSVSEIEECANSKSKSESKEFTAATKASSSIEQVDEKMSSSHHHQVNEEDGGSVKTLKSQSSLIDEAKLSKDKKSKSSLSPHIKEEFTKEGLRITEGNTSSRSSLIDEEELSKDKSVKSKSDLPQITEEFMKDGRINEEFMKDRRINEGNTSSRSSLIHEELSNDKSVKSKSDLPQITEEFKKDRRITSSRSSLINEEELSKDKSVKSKSSLPQFTKDRRINEGNTSSVSSLINEEVSKASLKSSFLQKSEHEELSSPKIMKNEEKTSSISSLIEEELSKTQKSSSLKIPSSVSSSSKVKSKSSLLHSGIHDKNSLLTNKDSERTFVDDDEELIKEDLSTISQIQEELTANKDSVEKSADVKFKSSLLQEIHDKNSLTSKDDDERTSVDDDEELSKILDSASSQIQEELTRNKDSVDKSVDVKSKSSLLQGIHEESRSKDSERTVDNDGNDDNKELSKKLGSVSSQINEELTTNKCSVEKSVKDIKSKSSLLQGIENEESRSKDSERTAYDDDGNDKNKELGSMSSQLIHEELTTTTSKDANVLLSIKKSNSDLKNSSPLLNEHSLSVKEVKESQESLLHSQTNQENLILSVKSKSQKKPEIAAENSIQSSLKEVKSSNSTSTLTLTENDLEKSLHVVVVKKEESKEHQEIDDEEVENSGQDTSISEQISLDSSSSTSHTSNSIHHQNNYNNKSEEDQSSSCYSSNNSNNKVIADGNCSIHRIQNQRRKEQQESNKNKPQVIERNEMMQHSISIFLNPKMHALNNATISQDQEKTIHQDLILSKKEEICRNIRNLKSSENQEIDDDEDVLSAINVDVDDGKLRKEENGNYSSSTFELEELDDEEEEEVEASSAKRRTLLRKNSHSSNSNSTSASVSSTENNSGLVKNVKKRVSEILAETQSPRAVDKSPRLQELYTTTYDVISPEHSPPPPKTESPPQVAGVHYVAKFGNEAEELFKIQLAIEQEIKQIEQQQKEQIPYMYMRDIPNKPPPPYTPPSSLQVTVPSVLPTTPEQIETIIENIIGILYTAHSNNSLENVTISEETIKFLINGNNIEKDSFLLVFNLCKEASIEHYKQFDQENHPIWMRTNTNLNLQKPLDKSGLEKMLKKQIKQLVGFEKTTIKENMIMKWSRKKRDHVDELLVNEAHNEESEWTNYDYDKHLVMQELTNDLMNTLINEATNDFTKILLKKGGYIL